MLPIAGKEPGEEGHGASPPLWPHPQPKLSSPKGVAYKFWEGVTISRGPDGIRGIPPPPPGSPPEE
eukprot:6326300-Karenia_brevis.AAC.1